MSKKWLFVIISGLLISLLAGCSEVEELLSKANQVLDQQLEKDESEGTTTDNDSKNEEKTDNDTTNTEDKDAVTDSDNTSDSHEDEEDDGQLLTLAERIDRGDLESIDIPNGFPMTIPTDWYLVQVLQDPEQGDYGWKGVFCFESDIIETAESYDRELAEVYNFDVVGESINSQILHESFKHTTNFVYNDDDPNLLFEGTMVYYISTEDDACTEMFFVYEYKD